MKVHPAVWILCVVGGLSAQSPLAVLDDATTGAGELIPGDFDGDGDFDLLSGVSLLLNDGRGNFRLAPGSPAPVSSSSWNGALAADFNGDGLDDRLTRLGGFSLSFATTTGGFVPGPPMPALPAPGALAPSVFVISADSGDVDADGDLDLLVATAVPAALPYLPPTAGFGLLLLNNGAGAFSVASIAQYVRPVAPFGPCFLRDVDGDGDPDVVFAGADQNFLPGVIVQTNVNGSFGVPNSPAGTPTTVQSAICADLDGDGRTDLVCRSAAPASNLLVYYGTTGGLAPPTTTSTSFSPFAGVDVDADGAEELVGYSVGTALELRTISGGVLGSSTSIAGPFIYVPDIQQWSPAWIGSRLPRDLDGDGDADLVLQSSRGPIRLMNDSSGGLVPLYGRNRGAHAALDPIYGDFDGDGDLDVASAETAPHQLSVSFADEEGRLVPGPVVGAATLGINLSYFRFFAFDRDGDGDDDLYGVLNEIAPSSLGLAGNDIVLDNTGGGSFIVVSVAILASNGPVVGGAAFDADGDGDDDLVLIRRTSTSTSNGVAPPALFIRNSFPAGLNAPLPLGGPHSSMGLAIADFDGDADLDIFQLNASVFAPPYGVVEQSVVYYNQGATFFAVAQPGLTGSYIASGDLTFDGLADVVIDGTIYSPSNGFFSAIGVLPTPLVNRSVLADLDGDGALDLLETPGTVMMNVGGAAFAPPLSTLPRQGASSTSQLFPTSRVVDLDRDGDLDVLAPGPRTLFNLVRHVAIVGQPSIGHTGQLDMYGTPGGYCRVFAAPAVASIQVPQYGSLLIDPSTAQLVAVGAFAPSTGAIAAPVSVIYTVPAAPAIVGLSLYWQAVDEFSLRLTNRTTSTIAGF